MTRRPKLSLSSEHNVDKKRPPGFETAAKVETPKASRSTAAPSPDVTKCQPEKIVTGDPASTDNQAAPQTTAWPTKQIVKVAIAIVAAALSLYLLKRRFL